MTWNTVAPTPDQITVVVYDVDTAGSGDWSNMIGGTSVLQTIPGGTLEPVKSDIRITVYSGNSSSYLGAHSAPGSWCLLGNHATTQALVTQ